MSTTENEIKARLSERAKKIVQIANEEAGKLKHAVVSAEHFLLGLIKEGSGVASNVLRNLNVDLGKLEAAISDKMDSSGANDAAAEKVVEADELLKVAEEESRELNHEKVGTEDLLLGILHDTKGLAGEVLNKFGVQLEAARKEVKRIIESSATSTSRPGATDSEEGQIDLSEKGRGTDGKPISLDRRLFMQFMAFEGEGRDDIISRFQAENAQAVVYQDVNDALGFGVMAFCEDPGYLIDVIQPILLEDSDPDLMQKHEYTMLGRTYSIGYENDLEDVLITRSAQRVCDPSTPWAVYYPVRRTGMFERQSKEDQRKMLMEHGGIGHAFGKAGFATDIRLAGHGLNKDDNDFIIGLLGKDLFPLSALVQRMRRTRQTSEFISDMGPFFVGRAVWQPKFDSFDQLK